MGSRSRKAANNHCVNLITNGPIKIPVAFTFCGILVVADGKVKIGVLFTGLNHRLKRDFIALLIYKENKVRTCVTPTVN